MRWHLAAAGAAAVAGAVAPATAFAVDYLTAEQAARQMFPDAERFTPQHLLIDAALHKQLEAQGLRPRTPAWQLWLAQRGGPAGTTTLGFVVLDEVIGKFELISYAVGVGLDGAIRQVEILSYRESHGHEVRLPAWRRQFVGKRTGAPLRVGEDIASISGATLSCSHVSDGIRRNLLVLDAARRSGLVTP